MSNKKHYRRVFKSDHLSSYDLEDFLESGVLLEFTIKEVKQYEMDQNKKGGVSVAGKTISANIAYFVEDIKPLVLNATNSSILSSMAGSAFVDDWKNIPVELYILKNIRFGKETVNGVRIKETPPKQLNEQDLRLLKGKISTITSNSELNVFYSKLSTKEKTNKEVLQYLKEKQIDLKQV